MKWTLSLPDRPPKPRTRGRTHLLDKGLGPNAVADLLATAAETIDLVKLGWGTAIVTEGLQDKVARYHEAGVEVCLGGTLLELAYLQGRVDDFERAVETLELTCVEVSDGTVAIPEADKLRLIERFAGGYTVYSEVGSKDAASIVTPARWLASVRRELAAGATKIILEGRESGTAGMYRESGEIRMGLIDEILEAGVPADDLVFEAPTKQSQVWFLQHVDSAANLGNVRPEDALPLETLRLGLRADTLLSIHR